jgi:hypothetical protein
MSTFKVDCRVRLRSDLMILYVKTSPKMWPNPFFVNIYMYLHNFNCGKKYLKSLANFVIFKKPVQSKTSPNRRKFAQSGHPDSNRCLFRVIFT